MLVMAIWRVTGKSGEILSMICDRGRDLSGPTRQSGGGYRWAGLPGPPGGHVPGQQLFDAIDFVISDMGQDVFEVGTRIDSVELARPDQTVRDSDSRRDPPRC